MSARADNLVVCLMGPTAGGKTGLAGELVERLPLEIVSADSAMVYRGMDIGTAKPDAATLERAPHRLIDIREPEESYSAGEFRRDALAEIAAIHDAGRIPLVVGGTMLYFRALCEGLAPLPQANPGLRAELDARAAAAGWPALHAELAGVDRAAAARIDPNDAQRIQRALEVHAITGRPLSELQRSPPPAGPRLEFLRLALVPASGADARARIAQRFEDMLERGLLEEVRRLRERPGLTAASPSMRAVGYRQLWAHLDGELDFPTACKAAVTATRRLAKRQRTWLRAERDLSVLDPLENGVAAQITALIEDALE